MKSNLMSILLAGMISCQPCMGAMKGRTPETFKVWMEKTNTPAKMESFRKKHFEYRYEETLRSSGTSEMDYVQTPLETYLGGHGGAEDYAALSAEWLKYHGYEVITIGCFGENDKLISSFCAVEEGNTWSYLGADGYWTGYKDLTTLIEDNPQDLTRIVSEYQAQNESTINFKVEYWAPLYPDKDSKKGYEIFNKSEHP